MSKDADTVKLIRQIIRLNINHTLMLAAIVVLLEPNACFELLETAKHEKRQKAAPGRLTTSLSAGRA